MVRAIVIAAFFVVPVSIMVEGCGDLGTAPSTSPQITSVQPDSVFAGDTLTITGANFGAVKGTSTVAVGGANADTIYAWTAVEIRLKVPASAVSGSVVVTVAGVASNAIPVKVRGSVTPGVSFANDVFPIFQSKGCVGCHGGNGNFFLSTYALLMSGTSSHGPVVVPGNGEGSKIIMKLRGTAAFGERMPRGGPYLDNATIDNISTWITQGALNN